MSHVSRSRSRAGRIIANKFYGTLKQKNKTEPKMNKSNDVEQNTENMEQADIDLEIINIKNKIQNIAEEHKIDEIKNLNTLLFSLIDMKTEETTNHIEEKEMLKGKIVELENNCKSMNEKIEENKKTIDHLISENDDETNYYKKTIDELKQATDTLKKELHERSENHKETINTFEEKNKNLEESLSKTRTQLEKANNTNKTTDDTLKNKYQELTDVKLKNEKLCAEIEEQKSELITSKKDSEELKATIEKLQKNIYELNNTIINYSQIATDSDEKLDELNFSMNNTMDATIKTKNNYRLNFAQELENYTINTTFDETFNGQTQNESTEKTALEPSDKNTKTTNHEEPEIQKEIKETPTQKRTSESSDEDIKIIDYEEHEEQKATENNLERKENMTKSKRYDKNNKTKPIIKTQENTTNGEPKRAENNSKQSEQQNETRNENTKQVDKDHRNNEDSRKTGILLPELERRLNKMEKTIENNTNRVETLEKHIQRSAPHTKKQQIEEKQTCHFIGDSHLRHIQERLENNEQFTRNNKPIINFKPGIGVMGISKLIPDDIDKKDTIILSVGTNDLYYTDAEIFKNQLKEIAKMCARTILISIPPQHCEWTNKDIIKLNTKIKHFCTQNNIETLNPHTFIKPEHLARDGIHLGRKAKTWLANKVMELINGNDRNKKKTTENENNENRETQKTNENIYRTWKPKYRHGNSEQLNKQGRWNNQPHSYKNQSWKQYREHTLGKRFETWKEEQHRRWNQQNSEQEHSGYRQKTEHRTRETCQKLNGQTSQTPKEPIQIDAHISKTRTNITCRFFTNSARKQLPKL
uniref:Uncharacterized protein n=2 Tax=Cacopsylla melanoneura TaxID=428564 RepID=A0A8D9AL14_9HEMI